MTIETIAMLAIEAMFSLLMISIAVVTVMGLLITMNKLTGSQFDVTLRDASSDTRLQYYAYRSLGIFVMAGLILS